jgi:hypothetical protein
MTTRRRFIQAVGVVPPALLLGKATAANTDASRLALVIGNGNYPVAPLENPANDARAMTGLLTQAGFSVSEQINGSRIDMMAAFDKFAADVAKSGTNLAIFYYAGHGAQLDWRNYLLPVDATVRSADQMRQSCVDLNGLIGKLTHAKDKTIIIVLDACRNNPFGSNYRPEQKGLSQFDAPPGSLLAYATSPGNVASDGQGMNGLYTEHLVRELSVPGTKIEDALKRVRVKVRIASAGAQTPWEVTSLEKDIFLFDTAQKKVIEASASEKLNADLAAWSQAKASDDIKALSGYLNSYPNGSFAEIAQIRLNVLLAEAARKDVASPLAEPVVVTQKDVASEKNLLIQIGNSLPMPNIIKKSDNPYSAGTYPLARKYSVGDRVLYQHADLLTGLNVSQSSRTVIEVDERNQRIRLDTSDNEQNLTDQLGNPFNSSGIPQQLVVAELNVGRSWSSLWQTRRSSGRVHTLDLRFSITRFEKISIARGEIEAFRIEATGYRYESGTSDKFIANRYWVVPGINFPIKHELILKSSNGLLLYAETREAISLRQATMDISGIVASGSTRSFNLRD